MNLAKFEKISLSSETIGAIFVVIFGAIFILANLFSGFNILLFLLFSLVGFFLAVLSPRSGIFAMVFLTIVFERFFTLQSIFWGRNEIKLYPIDVILLGVMVGVLFYLFKNKKNLKFNQIDLLMAIFLFAVLLYFIASLFNSEADPSLAFSSFKNYFFYGLIYFPISILFRRNEDQNRLFRSFLTGSIFIILFIFFGVFSGQGLWVEYTPLSTEGVRLLAFTHGFYLSLAVIGMVLFLADRGKAQKWQTFILAIWIFGIVGSMMRHLWLGIFLAVIFAFVYAIKEKRPLILKIMTKMFSIVFVMFVLVAFMATIAPTSSLHRTFERSWEVVTVRVVSLLDSSGDDSFSWREDTWQGALDVYVEHPFLGVGLGKKLAIDEGYSRGFVEVRNIHNSLLVLLTQTGLVVFAIFFSIVISVFKKLFHTRGKWKSDSLAVLIFFFLFVSLFQPYLETNLLAIFFWMMLGLARVQDKNICSAGQSYI
ncbi:MAG: O-antigen ligase family protein [Candidatus Moranbacteria bacterium]|nr:O-antigen ligase family protein [Candidatus Moranbacteria bacterium]